MTEYSKQYYVNNKEKIYESNKLYYQNNKEKVMATGKAYRLKNKDRIKAVTQEYGKKLQNINKHSDIRTAFLTRKISAMKSRHDSVTLTPEELLELIPKDLKCPVFETKFTFGMQPASLDKQRAMTVDRIDNTKGYHKDNVVIISFKANAMKNSATLKELYQVADFYHKLEKKLNA